MQLKEYRHSYRRPLIKPPENDGASSSQQLEPTVVCSESSTNEPDKTDYSNSQVITIYDSDENGTYAQMAVVGIDIKPTIDSPEKQLFSNDIKQISLRYDKIYVQRDQLRAAKRRQQLELKSKNDEIENLRSELRTRNEEVEALQLDVKARDDAIEGRRVELAVCRNENLKFDAEFNSLRKGIEDLKLKAAVAAKQTIELIEKDHKSEIQAMETQAMAALESIFKTTF